MKNLIKLNALTILFTFIAITLVANFACATDSVVKIGVLAKRGVERCLAQWSPTADYLTEAIPGKKFEIVPIDFAHIAPIPQPLKPGLRRIYSSVAPCEILERRWYKLGRFVVCCQYVLTVRRLETTQDTGIG